MEGKNEIPKWKKRTPTNYGRELLETWRKQYAELILHHPKWTCFEIIAKKHQVNRNTIDYHLFPDRKEFKKKAPYYKWPHEKANPDIHQKRIDYKKEYMHLRRHIDQYIEQAYACTPADGSMTLEDLSLGIEQQSGISLAPDTISGLNDRYNAKHGMPLIISIPDENKAKYRLNLDSQFLS